LKLPTNWSNFEGAPNRFSFLTASKADNFMGLSFPTISATGPNGAIIHYEPEKRTCATIDPKAIYLCDSGAQFK
jgi:Xaa-Pro aminopeptidase